MDERVLSHLTQSHLSQEEMVKAFEEGDAAYDGLFYVGVKTTGIYCLPSCKARKPRLENVRFLPSKQVAEQSGLRACKLCFPDLPVGRWRMEGNTVHLSVPPEFDFAQCLGYLERSPNECLHRVDHQDGRAVLSKALRIGEEKVLVTVQADEGMLQVGVFHPDGLALKKSTRMKAARFVLEWFDLERDLAPFYERAAQDAILRPVVQSLAGLRIIGAPDLFEALCWAVLGQQINLTFAYELKRRVVEKFGEAIEYEGRKHWLFPKAERIVGLTVEDLLPLQLSRKKAEYILGVAEAIQNGTLSKEKLQQIGNGKLVEQEMCLLRGIGPWTANYVRMRCLRDVSAFPIEDVGLHNALKQQLGWDRKPTLAEIHEFAKHWSGWEAYATFYLWQSLV